MLVVTHADSIPDFKLESPEPISRLEATSSCWVQYEGSSTELISPPLLNATPHPCSQRYLHRRALLRLHLARRERHSGCAGAQAAWAFAVEGLERDDAVLRAFPVGACRSGHTLHHAAPPLRRALRKLQRKSGRRCAIPTPSPTAPHTTNEVNSSRITERLASVNGEAALPQESTICEHTWDAGPSMVRRSLLHVLQPQIDANQD